jgi:hypothetical protein
MVMIFALECTSKGVVANQFTLIIEHLMDKGLVHTQATSS